MFRFDHTLMEPTVALLEQELREAATVADSRRSGLLLGWPLIALDDFFTAFGTKRNGWWQWNGLDKPPPIGERERLRRTRGRGHGREPRAAPAPESRGNGQRRNRARRSVVAVVWWGDRIGRRHVRIVGCQRKAVDPPEPLLNPTKARPAIGQVFPDQVFYLTRDGQTRPVVACGCGEIGVAEALGWMGDCCAACHDRREDGEVLATWVPRRLTGPRSAVLELGFSGDDRVLAASSVEGVIWAWDLRTGQQRLAARLPAGEWCSAVRTSPDGTAVLAETRPATIREWDLATGVCRERSGSLIPEERRADELLASLAATRGSEDVPTGPVLAIAPDGRTVAVADGPGYLWNSTIVLWDRVGGTRRRVAQGYPPGVVRFSPDGQTLITVANDRKTFRAWDVSTGAERVRIEDGLEGFSGFAFSPCGRFFATGDRQGRVKVWPAEVLGMAVRHAEPTG